MGGVAKCVGDVKKVHSCTHKKTCFIEEKQSGTKMR